MIEVASFPRDLTDWDGKEPPFYLEVFGETSPQLDQSFAEVIPPGGSSAQTMVSTPIYEYWWTIGHSGYKPEHRHLFEHHAEIWEHLKDPAAHVYLFFPINSGWRIKELVATAKYLSPVRDEKSLSEKTAEDWQRIAPILSSASTVSQALAAIPGVGVAAAGAAPILSALSKMQIGNIPQGSAGFEWFVEKVTTAGKEGRGVMQGVMWSIPKKMFAELGGRLTGSLAVSFIPSKAQSATKWTPCQAPMCAHAVVYAQHQEHWVPRDRRDFVELQITPVSGQP